MTQKTERIKQVISQISEKTIQNFEFSYNTEPKNKNINYFERTLAFFGNKDHIDDVNNIIDKLDQKSNRFLLIDGENVFFNFSSNIYDKLLIADLLEDYLKKNVFIIIFCQEHSILENGRFRGLQNFLNTYLYGFSNLYVFCKLDNEILTEHYQRNLQDIDHAPIIPDQSEIDDFLLVHCFNKLSKNNDNKVYIKSNDGFDWLNSNRALLKSIQKAKIPSSYDIPDITFDLTFDLKPRNFEIKVSKLESKYGKIKKKIRRVFRRVSPYTKIKKTSKKATGKKIKKKKKKTKKK